MRQGFALDHIGDELQSSPDPWLVFRQPLRGRGGEEKGIERGKGKGIAFPTSFLQLNHCSAVYSCCDIHGR